MKFNHNLFIIKYFKRTLICLLILFYKIKVNIKFKKELQLDKNTFVLRNLETYKFEI
jgi:hypothetical protein